MENAMRHTANAPVPLRSATRQDCVACGQRCCRSISFEVDTPASPEDFDHLRWMLAHHNVFVYIEHGEWYVEVAVDCAMLEDDGSCRIYETRPAICREHGVEMEPAVLCEGLQDVIATYERYFTGIDELEAFIPGYLEGLKKKKGAARRTLDAVRRAVRPSSHTKRK